MNNLVDDPIYSDLMGLLDEQLATHIKITNDDWDMHFNFPPESFLAHSAGTVLMEKELMERAIIVP